MSPQCARCKYHDRCTHQCMELPAGRHCADCARFSRCGAVFGAKADDTHCKFEPIRYEEAST